MRAELSPYAVDPFGPSANPGAYVACEASERARAILERSLDEGRVAALTGPPGHGKTLLLHLVGGREEDRARVAYVPFCTLEFDELCTVVLNALGVSRPGPPRDVLAAVTRELAPRGGVVVLVDDAHAMPEACATALAALYTELDGALRIALAAVQSPDAQRVFRAFGGKIDVVMLAGGMTGRESRRYVEERLAYGGAGPELVAAFDEATIDALHRASQGVPRRLNQAAEDIVRRATRTELPKLRQLTAAPAAPAASGPRNGALGVGRESERSERIAPRAAGAPNESRRPRELPRELPASPPVRTSAPPAPTPVQSSEPSAPRAARARSEVPPAKPPTRPPAQRSEPAAPRPAIRRVASPVSPPPPTAPPEDDGRGILLPQVFHREPGEPAGEYRIVRRTTLPSAPQTRTRRNLGTPESVLVARGGTPASPSPRGPGTPPARTREIPMPSAYADRVPYSPPSGLPIRTIGIAGFVLGLAVSMAWILGRGPDPPRVLPMMKPPPNAQAPAAPDAVAKRPAEPAQPKDAAAPARPAPEPERVVKHAAPERAPALPAAAEPAAPARVLVSINATPWATVRIDGREVGETPLAGIPLAPGEHLFEARLPDGTTRRQTIDVSPTRRTVVFQ